MLIWIKDSPGQHWEEAHCSRSSQELGAQFGGSPVDFIFSTKDSVETIQVPNSLALNPFELECCWIINCQRIIRKWRLCTGQKCNWHESRGLHSSAACAFYSESSRGLSSRESTMGRARFHMFLHQLRSSYSIAACGTCLKTRKIYLNRFTQIPR